ncbi:hypothetical protein I4J10_03395 [Corynebacterium diphtheriae bv. mitis]|uniref:hypothetical protein n=1 Tax=Corynebacterium diphtheriae TaxID=1717 RepID=UPI0013CD9CB4|nr:hypothetical protein [Corynebacterium diphtheriae]MBG9276256.1 hypothetical protein [Corynebacterium diphtheriae bv. mitis]MBG9280639.1 hypothetical protein [Corynebacterium diphtheriae bv. mitis]CAB0752422.1 hypothetical protein FRC0132_01341 [Corynebacterium diphtheriae]CAB0908805.1 hypothetical protein FRC0425_01497 [Corynebacterium diphtheriae]
MSNDLLSIGMTFDKWQDAVEAAIATDNLTVTGEVRGGQLIQYTDESGANINILAVEPFATFAGFQSATMTFAHVSMINDVLALCDIVDYNGESITSITCNLAQGPLLVDEPEQRWQQLGVTALAHNVALHATESEYLAANPNGHLGELISHGAAIVTEGNGSNIPDASAHFAARVLSAEYLTNTLTSEQFIHVTVDGNFPFDICLPASVPLPERDVILEADAVLVGSVVIPQGGGCGGGGCGGGGCGCGH